MMKPYYQRDGATLYHGDCRDVIGSIAYDVIVTDPPYLGRDDLFSTKELIPVLESLNLTKAFVFWACNYEYPFPYDALHIWHKAIPIHPNSKIGNVAGHHFEKIYAHGLGKKCEVFREAAIIPNFAAVSGELVSAGSDGHPTQKPLSLMRKLITRIPKGSIIFDPFSGSGTTLEAAKELGYEVIGCELQEKWCSATVTRLAQQSLFTLPNNRLHMDGANRSDFQQSFPADVLDGEGVLPEPPRQ